MGIYPEHDEDYDDYDNPNQETRTMTMLTNAESDLTVVSVETELSIVEANYKVDRRNLATRYAERRKKLRALLAVLKAEAEAET